MSARALTGPSWKTSATKLQFAMVSPLLFLVHRPCPAWLSGRERQILAESAPEVSRSGRRATPPRATYGGRSCDTEGQAGLQAVFQSDALIFSATSGVTQGVQMSGMVFRKCRAASSFVPLFSVCQARILLTVALIHLRFLI